MKNKKYVKQYVGFYFVSLTVLFVLGIYVFDRSGVEVSILLQIVISVVTAATGLFSLVFVDFLFVLLVSGLSRVSISQLYKYMNNTGYGTASLLSFLTKKGAREFRELIEDGDK